MPLKKCLCNVALFSLLIKVKYRVLFTDLFPYTLLSSIQQRAIIVNSSL